MEISNQKGKSFLHLCPNEYADTITQFKGVKRYADINEMIVIGHQTIFSHYYTYTGYRYKVHTLALTSITYIALFPPLTDLCLI